MNVPAYLSSGIIEAYCLGLLPETEAAEVTRNAFLFPALQDAIDATEATLQHYAATPPRPALKRQLFETLRALATEAAIDLANPPLIGKDSDLEAWKEAVRGLRPNMTISTAQIRVLRFTPEHQLCLAWLSEDLVEEPHHPDAFRESFFILEGTCECNLGGQTVRLRAGDYLDVPAHTPHTIRPTAPQPGYVKALIQRVAA
jgi:mannose-6-phosphate isomerase-like protein (cupin superfamily)